MQSSSHNPYSVFIGCKIGNQSSNPFMLTGGSDLRLRYWDLVHPENSALVSAGAYDPVQSQNISYR